MAEWLRSEIDEVLFLLRKLQLPNSQEIISTSLPPIEIENIVKAAQEVRDTTSVLERVLKKERGRPKGSKNVKRTKHS